MENSSVIRRKKAGSLQTSKNETESVIAAYTISSRKSIHTVSTQLDMSRSTTVDSAL